MIELRTMQEEDARAVAQIEVLAWQKAYQDILPEAYLKNLSIEKKTLLWEQGMILNNDIVRLIATENNKVLGFACGLENRFPELMVDVKSELWSLYVHPDHWHQKIGTKLLQGFGLEMKKRESRNMAVWVLKQNLPALGFYHSQGGQLLSQTRFNHIGGESSPEIAFQFTL